MKSKREQLQNIEERMRELAQAKDDWFRLYALKKEILNELRLENEKLDELRTQELKQELTENQ
jgi:hypothetical protein